MVSLLQAPQLSTLGFRHGFSLRQGGVSQPPFSSLNLGRELGDDEDAVTENRRRLSEAVGYRLEGLVEVHQVHGAAVVAVPGPCDDMELAALRDLQADALVSHNEDMAIAVRTADCLPLLLADPESGSVAAVHAGWRGVVAGVVKEAIEVLCGVSHAPASRLRAAIFPHIRHCCFEIGDEVAEALAAITPDAVVHSPTLPKPHGDLQRAVCVQLVNAGFAASRIENVAGCTQCDAERFYSYRRDGKESGRHLCAIIARGHLR